MNLEELKKFLQEKKDDAEVQAAVREVMPVQVGAETLRTLAESDDNVKNFLQAEKDRHFSKSLDTWKEKSLPKILEEEKEKIRKELNPDEDPVRKELREVREEMAREKAQRTREALRNKAYKDATSKGLPLDLLDMVIGDDEEKTTANLQAFEKVWEKAVQDATQGVFKKNGRQPVPPAGKDKAFTREQVNQMSEDEITANWDTISKQMEEGTL